jgi:tyrosine-protein phosphatase YwqE
MFSFLKKKHKIERPFSALKVDMHSHLIPGIDDGAATLEHSVSMIKSLSELGYDKIITTPHTYYDYYPNTKVEILEGLDKVRNGLAEAEIDIKIDAASEYYMDEHFEKLLGEKDLLTLGDSNYVLVEMSFFGPPPALEDYIFQMGVSGYSPILAHPERYPFFANEFGKYERMIELGCSLQVNTLSLAGHYGGLAQKTAQKLLKKGMVTFLGTDCHNENHIEQLQAFGQSGKWKKYAAYNFKNNAL